MAFILGELNIHQSINLVRTILIALFSAAASALFAFAAVRFPVQLPDSASIVASGLFALVVGLLHGKLFGAAAYKAVGVGAFLGLCIIWVPVVIVTYGFALTAFPYLVAYAGIVAVGVEWSAKLAPRKAA